MGFGAPVTLSVRSSNWIPNTQRSAETLGRGESKGRGVQQIKRGILPGPQRLQHEGWEGTLARGCPSGGGRGRKSPSRRQRLRGLLPSSLMLRRLRSQAALGLCAILSPVGHALTPVFSRKRSQNVVGRLRSQLDLGPDPGLPPAASCEVRASPSNTLVSVSSSME